MKKVLIISGIAIFILIVIILVIVAAVSKKNGGGKNSQTTGYPSEDLTLTYWRIFDEEDALKPIIEEYQKQHKNVTISVVAKNSAEYEIELINALAGGSGPDLFQIKNDWLTKHIDKLSPMPEDYMSTDEYKDTFAPVAAQDLISDNRIYGMPFYIDTLALYYNKNLISAYNGSVNSQEDESIFIQTPPQNWTELIDQVKKLTNKNGTFINQAGVALGTSNNVESSQDILSLLMLQNNTKMVSEDKKTPTFNLSTQKETGQVIYPGTSALDFYTSFALPNKETYSWNSALPSSTEAFIQGKTAIMLNYSDKIDRIKNLAPDLEFGTTMMPQVKGAEKRIDYASYWPEVVSKESKYPQVAWDFLKFATEDIWQRQYNLITKRLPSRIDLVKQEANFEYITFSGQIETSTNWHKGTTPDKVNQIFKDMITAVVEQNQPSQKAIDAAAEQIKTLWQK